MADERGLHAWLNTRAEMWRGLTATLDRLESRRDHSASEAFSVIETYRALGRDLSIARRILPAGRLTRALEERFARLHSILYRKPHHWSARISSLFRDEIPAVVHELRTSIVWVSLLFALTTGA